MCISNHLGKHIFFCCCHKNISISIYLSMYLFIVLYFYIHILYIHLLYLYIVSMYLSFIHLFILSFREKEREAEGLRMSVWARTMSFCFGEAVLQSTLLLGERTQSSLSILVPPSFLPSFPRRGSSGPSAESEYAQLSLSSPSVGFRFCRCTTFGTRFSFQVCGLPLLLRLLQIGIQWDYTQYSSSDGKRVSHSLPPTLTH